MYNNSYYFLVLDIETSSLYDENDISQPCAVWLAYGYIKLYKVYEDYEEKYYFREWEELKDILIEMSSRFQGFKTICYVHNLSYEFDFLMKNISKAKSLLANKTHGVISGILEGLNNIEFRCSYQLTGYSLARLGEILNYPKLDSDYRLIYPYDEVTKEEKKYCERDCDIVAKYLKEKFLPQYNKIHNIPFTTTGIVRTKFKEFYKETEKNCEWDLMPDEDCFDAMVHAFMGGITTSNPLYTNIALKNVHSYDEESAYPYAMLKEKYGSKITKINSFSNDNVKEKMWIAKIRFNLLQSHYDWGWISAYKSVKISNNTRRFNGKIIFTESVDIYLSSVDFETLNLVYDYESFEVLEFYRIENIDRLPTPYIKTLIHFGEIKHKLKQEVKSARKNKKISDYELQELENDYMIAKGHYNSIYGMSVQKLMPEEYEVNDFFVWKTKEKEYKKTDKHLYRNFLFGIYITAYARRNLIRAIVKNCPTTFVYCDTDSIKFIGENKFYDTNEPLDEDLLQYPQFKTLGSFDYEGTYDNFKTMGAKKYCYSKDDKWEIVVAGLPKVNKLNDNSKWELTSCDDFYLGRIFPKCKLNKKYILGNSIYEYDDETESILNLEQKPLEDFYRDNDIITNGGVLLFPVDYRLDMTLEDQFFCDEIQYFSRSKCNEKKKKNI